MPPDPLYRYQASVRAYLSAAIYDDAAERPAADAVLAAAETMSDPADLINRVVEAQAASTDLPAFSTLDRLPHDTASKVWHQPNMPRQPLLRHGITHFLLVPKRWPPP